MLHPDLPHSAVTPARRRLQRPAWRWFFNMFHCHRSALIRIKDVRDSSGHCPAGAVGRQAMRQPEYRLLCPYGTCF
jgi:hypothetical protein